MATKKILMVDDDVDFVSGAKAFLEGNGFVVAAAYDGDEGKKMAVDGKPDLIILDVVMKTSTEGFEVARALREMPETRKTPIIMLTSVNQKVPWRFGPDEVWLPVDTFLDKPAPPQRLLAEVKKVTG